MNNTEDELLSNFPEGTQGYLLTAQAIQIVKAARQAGLNNDADLLLKSLSGSIRSKNLSGFNANIQMASAIAEKVKVAQEDQKKLGESVSKIAALADYAKNAGFKVDPSHIASAIEMKKNKNVSGLDELSNLLAADVTRQAASQEKLAEAQAKGKLDPSAQIEANKSMANKLMLQFWTAQKILNDPEAPKAFTGVPKVRAYNEQMGIGNNIKENMATISGFNLGKGMQEIKEQTGTGSGMSEAETSAFRAAQSSLNMNQDWPNAIESLQVFNSATIRALKKLGVRNEYLNQEGADKWLKNTDINIPLLDIEKVERGQPSTGQQQYQQPAQSQSMTAPTPSVIAGLQLTPDQQSQLDQQNASQATQAPVQAQAQQQPVQQTAPAPQQQQQINPYEAIRSKLNLPQQ